MLKNIIKISLLSSVFSLVVTIPAMPYSAFTDQAKELYSVRSRCEMCHIGPQLNSFGKDFAMEWGKTHDIVKSYKAIENLDSDRDGFLNIDEIKAMSLPGDKVNVPSQKKVLNISNSTSYILKKSH